MAQTPAQRRANAKYAKVEEEKRGKPLSQQKKKTDKDYKSPISTGWLVLLAIVVCGGVFVEVMRIWF